MGYQSSYFTSDKQPIRYRETILGGGKVKLMQATRRQWVMISLKVIDAVCLQSEVTELGS